MFRITQLFSLFALLVLMASSATAFTPDAAFKMNNLMATTRAPSDPKRAASPTPQQAAFAKQRNVQLSLIGQENIRKSITVPPAYEDYMAVRERSLRRLLGRN